jgi:hypothetical protein
MSTRFRPLVARLLVSRRPRRPPRTIGACRVCGVVFAASIERGEDTAQVLRVHERICPGGLRAGDVVTPFD